MNSSKSTVEPTIIGFWFLTVKMIWKIISDIV